MKLHILDVSNYIYAGTYSGRTIQRGIREDNGEYGPNEAPIGGVRFLLHQIGIILRDKDAVVMPVFDTPPKIKRQMYAETYGDEFGYKAGRKKKDISIDAQKNYAEDILRDMGFVVQKADDYEADDVIHSLVYYYKNDFDHIYIHTKDSDLYYLIDNNVSIATVGDKGKNIDIYNYMSECKSGEFTQYNTVHINKLIKGDTSDNIPGRGKVWGAAIYEQLQPEDFYKLGDLDFARKKIRDAIAAHPEYPNSMLLYKTFNLLVPLLVPYEMIDDTESDINEDKLIYYLHDWNAKEDKWGLEDILAEYIDTYYK